MTYLCFVESDILASPRTQPLAAETAAEARAEAERLLRAHAGGYAIHVFENERRLLTIRRPKPGPTPP